MLSQSEALRFEEVFSKFSGKEFSSRIAMEEIEEALAEMKVKVSSEGLRHLVDSLQYLCRCPCIWPSRIERLSCGCRFRVAGRSICRSIYFGEPRITLIFLTCKKC
jgi:hypothetical protein